MSQDGGENDDNDGKPDWEQFHAGNNPFSPSEKLRVAQLTRDPQGLVTLTCTGPTNMSYRLFRATNSPMGDYLDLGITVFASQRTNVLIDTKTLSLPRCFYRVRASP